MKDPSKTNQDLIEEISVLQNKIQELEQAETGRKQAMAKLQESEDRYRHLIETSHGWVWEVDHNGSYTYVSPQVQAILGYAPEEMIGKKPFDLMPEDEAGQIEKVFVSIVANCEPLRRLPNINRHKDGHLIFLETNGIPFFDREGNLLGYRGMDSDITERKRAEDELKLFKSIIESSSEAIAISDSKGRLIYINHAHEKLFGRSLAETQHLNYRDYYPPESIEILNSVIAPALERGESWEGELDALGSAGKRFPLWERADSLLDASGQFQYGFGIMHDITERRQTEELLRDRKADLDLALQSSRMGVWSWDIVANIRIFDDQTCNLLGLNPERFNGSAEEFFAAVHCDDHEEIKAALTRTIESGVPYETEYRSVWPDGSIHYICARGRFIRDDKGKPLRISGVLWDKTDHQQTGDALRESETLHRQLMETLPAGVIIVDPLTRIIESVNDAAAAMFCAQADIIVGHRCHAFLCPASEGACPVCDLGKEVENAEREMICADGSRRPVLKSVKRIQVRGQEKLLECFVDITEYKQAQEEIKRQAGLIRSLLDSIPDIIFFKDINGVYLGCNPPFAEFVGKPREEIVGRTDYDLFDKGIADFFRGHDQRMLELRESRNNEEWITYPDGRKILIDTLKTPYWGPDESLIGVLGISRDITYRKQSEEALQQTTDRLMLAAQAGGVGIWDYDIVNNVLAWDDMMYSLYGISPDQFSGAYEAWQAGLHPEDMARGDIEIQMALRGEKEFDTEFRVVWPDGAIRNIRAFAIVQRDAAGLPVRMMGTNWDITTQKQAERSLRESEETVRLLLDSVAEAIYGIDMNGNCTFCNNTCLHLLGYEHPKDLLGKNMHRQIHSKYPDGTFFPVEECRIYKAFHDGKGTHVNDEVLWRSDDTSFPAEYWSYPLLRDGLIVGAVVTFFDITERKKAEADLLEANRRLEAAIALSNEMAVQAQMASIAKSEFLANMSHEIRTPMNGVIGMTGLLLDTELSDEQRRYAETVRTSGESLLTLLNDILDFSKIEAGKLELETLDFDLCALLDDFAAMLAMRAHDKGIEFICAAAPDVPAYLQGDPGRLRQILVNLTGNAVKFTHKGEIAVRASLVSETDDEAVIRFSIKDTGIGVPADKQALLFQKFSQADASTTRKYGGTGLGLAISKQLAEMMGGEIGIKSEEGHGSEFWFTARFVRQIDREQNVLLPTEISGVHILIVDDNATNREVLMAQLRTWGMRAEETPDGPTALQALYQARDAGDPFQMAILDMQMPGMDGATLGRVLKVDDTLKDTRLVLLSSFGRRGDAKHIEEIGFAAYLTKPVRQSDLHGCLSTLLAGTKVSNKTKPIVTRHTIRELRRGNVRILLAEDNITNQQVAIGILKKMGLRADAAANGAEAVKALESIPYDLVLMDVQMPVMDGMEATRQIRDPKSAVLNHHIPIIAMTAHAMRGDRKKFVEAGMNDYVPKPVSPQELAEALDKWLPQDGAAKKDFLSAKTQVQAPEKVDHRIPASAVEPAGPVFDKPGMMARLMDDEDLARKLIECFLDDIPKQILMLRSYLEKGDAASAERQAHTIKGASSSLGGEVMRALAFEMEKAGKAGELEVITASLPELETQFALLKEAMNEFLNSK